MLTRRCGRDDSDRVQFEFEFGFEAGGRVVQFGAEGCAAVVRFRGTGRGDTAELVIRWLTSRQQRASLINIDRFGTEIYCNIG